MPLTIIFNGTSDTYYPDDQSYLKANKLDPIGEGTHTLSFFADCIETSAVQIEEPLFSQIPPSQKDPYLLKISNELVIIQGPDDTGTKVHDLIITGLMTALNALLRGEYEINFVGFSRGSVEAIHMTHELQRIKDYLNDTSKDQSYIAIVQAISEGCYNPGSHSLLKWRTNRLKSYYESTLLVTLQNPALLEKLQQGLDHSTLKFNGMLLDPVPGLCEGTRIPSYIPWTTLPHHTMVPPILNELNVTYMDSEFSVGFRAIWIEPTPNSNTKITRMHLPGCHGTANGNPVNHNPALALTQSSNPFPFQKLRGVQKVYFYKLLQFGIKHGIVYKNPEHLRDRYLTSVFEHFMLHQDNLRAQNKYLREQYKEIAENLDSYRKTRETCYVPEWLKTLGLGGREQINNERILMTQQGPISMADCFNFDIKGANSYVNFDSFFLDFLSLLFPEATDSPTGSPTQMDISYSTVARDVTTKYNSSTEMDYSLLFTKIEALLAACHSHDLNADLNKIIQKDALDHKGLLSQLIELVPTKLVGSFYHSNLSDNDKEKIQQTISNILSFEMNALSSEEQSPTHHFVYEKKQNYLKNFRTNMQKMIQEQTHKSVENLLENKENFLRRALNPDGLVVNTLDEESSSSMDPITYLEKAEQYYQHLKILHAKIQFAFAYLSLAERQNLQYKLEEAIIHFPFDCERILTNRWHEYTVTDISSFTVLRPLLNRLNRETTETLIMTELQSRLESSLQELNTLQQSLRHEKESIAILESEITTNQTRIETITNESEHAQEILRSQIVENNDRHTAQLQVSNATVLQHETKIRELNTQLQSIRTLLQAHHQFGCYSGFTLVCISSFSILLGALLASIATSGLILGSSGLIPIVGLIASTSLIALSIYGVREGCVQQHWQHRIQQSLLPELEKPGVKG